MKIRAQIGMVLNLDKCIGCHTCSVTCKNVWTNRPGMEYAWFNNVESKPGVGYPRDWENQERWNGGWVKNGNGSKIKPKQGGKLSLLAKIFANPNLPELDDYYEPFTFDYEHLHDAPKSQAAPVARPRSLITGERMEKIKGGPNWEEILGGEFEKRSKDYNFEAVQKEMKLTSRQVQTINRLFESRVREFTPFLEDMNKQLVELNRMTAERTVDVSTFSVHVNRLEALRSKLNETRTVMLYTISKQLSPEQVEKLKELREQRDRRRMGRGAGSLPRSW